MRVSINITADTDDTHVLDDAVALIRNMLPYMMDNVTVSYSPRETNATITEIDDTGIYAVLDEGIDAMQHDPDIWFGNTLLDGEPSDYRIGERVVVSAAEGSRFIIGNLKASKS